VRSLRIDGCSPHTTLRSWGLNLCWKGKEKEAGEEGISIGHCCVLREEGDIAGGRKRHNMITIFCSDSTNQKAIHCSDSKAVHYTYKYQLSVTSNCLISMKCCSTIALNH